MVITVILAVYGCPLCVRAGEAEQSLQTEAQWNQETLWDQAEEYLDVREIEESLKASDQAEEFSFSDAVRSLIRGEIPFQPEKIGSIVSDIFFSELNQQRKTAVQILVVVLASAVFSNFVTVFENNQIADISFYMMYLLISTLLVRSFAGMSRIAVQACTAIADFMKVLLPSYLITVVLSSGSVTALGFYEITVMAVNILQFVMIKLIFPGIHFYLILLILNQLAQEDCFSRFAKLAETVISWTLRSILGIVVGLQAVQCLIAPTVDSLKNSAAHRLARLVPGIGSALDAAAETVAGSAVLLKNAVGVAGILALALICLTPLVKLAASILMFRLLCALIQPVCEKRTVEGIESISGGAMLLLRTLLTAVSIFIISLAMITSAVKSG